MNASRRRALPGLVEWTAALAAFPLEIRTILTPWVSHIERALGPLRVRATQGPGEMTGLGGLARRGPYERLLMSEWLLSEEVQDEFARRAAVGEHLFLAVEREEPRNGRASAVLVDSGPEQLGAPRLAQLAALLVFARRAESGGAEFRWGSLQDPTSTLHGPLDIAACRAFLDSRSLSRPQPGDLERWSWLTTEAPRPDDLWLVGGTRATALAGSLGASALHIEEVGAPETRGLELRVLHRNLSGMALRLERAPAADETRMLRDPFAERPTARPRPTASLPFARPLQADTALSFSPSGRRLFARLSGGAIGIFAVTDPRGQNQRSHRQWHPPPDRDVLAVGWSKGTFLALQAADDGAVTLGGHFGGRDMALRHPTELVSGSAGAAFAARFTGASLPSIARFRAMSVGGVSTALRDPDGGLWLVAAGERLRKHELSFELAHITTQGALFTGDDDGTPCGLSVGSDGRCHAAPWTRWIGGRKPLTSGDSVLALGAPEVRGASASDAAMLLARADGAAEVHCPRWTEPVPFRELPEHVRGLVTLPGPKPRPLVVFAHSGKLATVDSEGVFRALPTAGGDRVVAASVSPDEPSVAWLTEGGRLSVWHIPTDRFLLDVQLRMGAAA